MTLCAVVCALQYSVAQQVNPSIEPLELSPMHVEAGQQVRRMAADVTIDENVSFQHESRVANVKPVVLRPGQKGAPRRAAEAVENKPGYLNPEGTLFLGVDEKGKGVFFKDGQAGVVGAWSSDLDAWEWRNTTKGEWTGIKYDTWLSASYPSDCEDALYYTDANGNFFDSIVARGGWQEFYAMGEDGDVASINYRLAYQAGVPVQRVAFDTDTMVYQMLTTAWKPSAGAKDKRGSCAFAIGGTTSSNSSDGLWPLTNAINLSKEHGMSMDLIASRDSDGYVHYLFGSSAVTIDSTEAEGVKQYIRTAPVKLTTSYDKPQRMLYVKSISLALSADGYNAFQKDTMKLTSLHVAVKDHNGQLIAEADATPANYSSMTVKAGQLLTFHFPRYSAYGELLSEGFTVDDAFTVELTGFTESDRFGIYAARCTVYDSKTKVLYADGEERGLDYEPYIMLNGIYPTLEDYYAVNGVETDAKGDTIPVQFNSVKALNYSYVCSYANSEYDGDQEFAFYSTFKPYDASTRYWNFDIERPEYVIMAADYEYNMSGDDNDPITIWDYMRAFTLHIYATATPKIGDEIKIGKAGRQMVLKVAAVDGATALGAIKASESGVPVRKLLKNGQVLIEKGDQIYNTLGQYAK